MIVLASIIAPHKLDEGYALKWLEHFQTMRENYDGDVNVFLAAEIDARGLSVYEPIMDRLNEVGATIWTYSIDKAPSSSDDYEITSNDRFIRIATGRNLGIEYALNTMASHILFVDTDTEVPGECLEPLTQLGRGLVFGHVPTYNLDGPMAEELPGDCRWHWSSAGFCLVSREVFRHVRWAWDPDAEKTDDPTFARDVENMGNALGKDWRPVTRHDVIGRHWPESIYRLEDRPVDRKLYR